MSKHFNMTALGSFALALVLACLATWVTPAFALTEPDLGQPCSLTVTLQDTDGHAAAGAEVTLYRVGTAVNNNGDFSYQLTDDFASSGADLSTIGEGSSAAAIASQCGSIASEKQLSGQTAVADATGTIQYQDLQVGVYLVVITKQPENFAISESFLVTLPQGSAEQGWTYDVDATPKPTVRYEETPDNPPSNPPSNPPKTPPTTTKLPQTGVNWWPVFGLAFVGLLLFGIGWHRYRRSAR